MRILFIGDSLGLPRPHRINNYSPEERELAVSYEDTYSSILNLELLKEYNFDPYIEVINRSKRFYTIKNISDEFTDHLFYFEPDIVVLQVGIVDCWFRDQLNGKQMVNKIDYEKYLRKILLLLQHRPNCRLIIVGIAPTSTKMENRFEGLNTEISSYNNILKSYVNNSKVFYVDLEKYILPSSPNNYLLPDDQHLNKTGNKLLARLLKKVITGLIESDKGVHIYETGDLHQALIHMENSYNCYPFYKDNLYNTLILSHQLKRLDLKEKLTTFITDRYNNDKLNELIIILDKEYTDLYG